MSTVRLVQDGLTISTSVGPAEQPAPNSKSRIRVEIDASGSHAQLDMDQWIDLVCFIRRLDQRSLSITTTPEVS